MSKSRRQLEDEMREEMEFHRQARIDDLVRTGLSAEEAARKARLEFGNAEAHREECRTVLGFRPWDELRADLRYTVRTLRRSPGFAVAAVAILALAIGANASFFSLYANYVLKPMPIRGVDRHFDVEGRNSEGRRTGGWTAAEQAVLREAAADSVEGFYTAETLQMLALAPVQRHCLVTDVSGNYFALLGGVASRGRVIGEPDRDEPVAVISETGWRKLMPGEADPLGKTVKIKRTVYTVIGVMSASFTGTESVVPDLWVPTHRERPNISGLLREGIAPARAEAAIGAAAGRMERPLDRAVARVEVELRSGFLPNNEDLNTAAAMVLGVFLMVLLIACANLANLYLARAAARTHEVAMRLSLGATRARVVRQLLTESTFVAMLGAMGGLGVAAVMMHYANEYMGRSAGAMGMSVVALTLDWRVFLYSAGLALAAGVAFGLLPALEVTSPSLTVSTKRENSSFAGRVRPRRMRDLLIGGQVAASLVLLILSGVLVRNIQRIDAVDPGFDLDRVFDLRVDEATPALMAKLEREPGMGSLTAVEQVPLFGQFKGMPATNRVDHRYFETLGLRLEAGRNFTAQEAQFNAKVAVVSRATALKLWPGQDAVGQIVTVNEREKYQVIGVVGDIVTGFLFQGKDATAVYLPAAAGQPGMLSFLARLQTAPAAIRTLCAANDVGCEPMPMREIAKPQRAIFQGAAAIAGSLGGLALLLTAIGLYSVASYSVVQRRREIGVHLALGATQGQVMRRILGEAGRCVAGGLLVGLPFCLGLSKLASASVLRIETFDPAAYVFVPALLTLIAVLACAMPARRAAQLDPMLSLREE